MKARIAIGHVGAWTLVSRITGFMREIVFAAFFGSSAIAEAFQVAFALPNMFRRFFAEGAMNTAFVPLYTKLRQTQGNDADRFVLDTVAALGAFLIVFSALLMIAMPGIVWLMASGFFGDERFALSVAFGRICFPYLMLISLMALIGGTLNARGHFRAAAAAPVLLNIVMVGAMWLAAPFGFRPEYALVWSVPLAGALQLACVWFALRADGFTVRPVWPRWTPQLRELAIIAGPALLTGGVVQINFLVARQVGSQTAGAIQWLAVSERIAQLPLGVIGIAIGVVLLPTLSKARASGDEAGAKRAFNASVAMASLPVIPAAIAMAVVAEPIVRALFERGAFLASDTLYTAQALIIYSLGLPAFVLQKLYQNVFFARGDTRTPFRITVVTMFVNAALAVGLYYSIDFLAAAVASVGSAYVMLALLIWYARGTETQLSRNTRLSLIASLLGALLLGALLFGADALVTQLMLGKYAALSLYILLGVATVGGLILLPFNRRLLLR